MIHSFKPRKLALSSTQKQIDLLNSIPLTDAPEQGNFDQTLAAHSWNKLAPAQLEIFQINMGKLCNMACHHCHVDAGPDRKEMMTRDTVDACLRALDKTTAHTVDITGGAPELNPHFRYLVDQCIARGKHVIDRCNLTVLLLPTMADLPAWFAARGVEVVCSLPHYRQDKTDDQRGENTFEQSIIALQRLNSVGYGKNDPHRQLTLVSNPTGPYLSGDQKQQEQIWKDNLLEHYGVTFDRLIAINNMPISRYLEGLQESGQLQSYMELLVNAFSPCTIKGLMCRNTLSVSWDGRLFDCDFNQMLELNMQMTDGQTNNIQEFDLDSWAQRQIVTGRHCFGCTAGKGSSCGGALS